MLIKSTGKESFEKLSKHWWFNVSYNDWDLSKFMALNSFLRCNGFKVQGSKVIGYWSREVGEPLLAVFTFSHGVKPNFASIHP